MRAGSCAQGPHEVLIGIIHVHYTGDGLGDLSLVQRTLSFRSSYGAE